MKHLLLSAAAAVALFPAPAHAGDAPATRSGNSADANAAGSASAAPVPGSAKDAHPDTDQAIVITGVRRPAGDVLGGVTILDQEKLTRDVRPSIGETLASQPGVSASSFGPTASRPVLRGLSGERVRILVDGIGSLDLSASDPDHAVAINPLTAERIEVLRGPSALLFGSSAIGGVVNVIDSRIPRHVPDGPVAVNALATYGTAANERSANLSADVPLGGNFVGHFDGSYSKYDDLDIGGYVLSDPLRRQAAASTDPAIRALADLKGTLLNTAGRVDDIAGGIAYVDGGLNIGLSYNHHDARYGVPIRYSLNPSVEPEAPTIDAHQDRGDARVNIPLGGGLFETFEWRGGFSKYRHSEIEEDGEVGSRFFTNGGEMRADLVQAKRGGWGGTTGIQYFDTDVRIRGDEKYLPDSRNRQFGIFTLQSLVRGPVRFEGGLRVEFASLDSDADAQIAANGGPIGATAIARDFTAVSGSVGANYDLAPGWRAGLSLSHSERAPAIDELFSNGPHGGSQQFLVGNPGLGKERSNSIELSLHGTSGPVHVQGSLYYSRFGSFIFQAPTGAVRDDLPVYNYAQGKADYYGFELQSDAKLGRALGIDWGGELVSDAVRATIRNFGPAPLIPPLRILGALTGSRGQVDGRLEVEHAFAHDRTAPNETDTPGYTLVNASLDWHPFAANPELTLSLQGNNLFDVDARRSTSVLKDFAPLSGRDIRLSARLAF
ncbi:MAG TPA: TonB-dependent receptor [Sphingomicrobium sp.]|nr:TonB-dependent receptor [Sphingomicrobium sp.]